MSVAVKRWCRPREFCCRLLLHKPLYARSGGGQEERHDDVRPSRRKWTMCLCDSHGFVAGST